MADLTLTMTIGAGEWVFIDINGVAHTVTTSQTFTWASTDGTGDTAIYRPIAGQSVSTTDGYLITMGPGSDDSRNHISLTVDTAVTHSNGALGDIELGFSGTGEQSLWKCTGFDPDDADALDDITAASFERVDNPLHKFTWANIGVSNA